MDPPPGYWLTPLESVDRIKQTVISRLPCNVGCVDMECAGAHPNVYGGLPRNPRYCAAGCMVHCADADCPFNHHVGCTQYTDWYTKSSPNERCTYTYDKITAFIRECRKRVEDRQRNQERERVEEWQRHQKRERIEEWQRHQKRKRVKK